jgi:tetratricopeptide (TPR) repeat protein
MSLRPLILCLALSTPTLAVADDGAPDLRAFAAASSRPRECAVDERTGRPTFWRRARFPQQVEYCALVARSLIELQSDPAAAADTAERAMGAWPGRTGAKVARARALLAGGKVAPASELLLPLEEVEPALFEEPHALWALAKLRALAGDLVAAEGHYRKLVPRVRFLRALEREQVLVEAAFVLFARTEAKDVDAAETERLIEDAASFLAEAVELAPDSSEVLFAAVLGDMRRGDGSAAALRLRVALATGASPASPGPTSFALTEVDRAAVAALRAEALRPLDAAASWAELARATRSERFRRACSARAASRKSPTPPKRPGARR